MANAMAIVRIAHLTTDTDTEDGTTDITTFTDVSSAEMEVSDAWKEERTGAAPD